ncbi:MAG TPA: hypothetical protein VGD03_09430 [Frankiaceae bacterium]
MPLVRRVLPLPLAAAALLAGGMALPAAAAATTRPAAAAAAATPSTDDRDAVGIAYGRTIVSGDAWLGGLGADVVSNGQAPGGRWTPDELVRRLYTDRGWITPGSWPGAPGQLFDTAPAGLTKEPQGTVTGVAPGDVIVFGTNNGQTPGSDAVVDTVAATGALRVLAQGSQPASFAPSQVAFSRGTITLNGSGRGILGVVHRPAPDLVFVHTRNTSSGAVELATATGNSGFTAGTTAVTRFPRSTAALGTLQLVGGDLWLIQTRGTASGTVELHSATAATGYARGADVVTGLPLATVPAGALQVAPNGDLVQLATVGTPKNRVEVRTYAAAGGYRTATTALTRLTTAQAAGGSLQLAGRDVALLQAAGTRSGAVELHTATAASGYATGVDAVTWIPAAERDHGTVQLVGGTVYAVKTRATTIGRVEVHTATAASGYRSGTHAATRFGATTAGDGTFEIR